MTERVCGFGIDLGTSNSAVCRIDVAEGRPDWALARDTASELEIVSAAFLDTNGELYFGGAAARRQDDTNEADRVVFNFKLLLRDNEKIRVPGAPERDAVDLVRHFLRYLKKCYVQTFNDPVGCNRAVITVPAGAGFDADYRQRLREAVFGGPEPVFESVDFLEEPEAALMSMVDMSALADSVVLIFDMGGGTLDVSVRRVTEREGRPFLEHLGLAGSPDAGVEVTAALTDHIRELWEKQRGEPFTPEDRERIRKVSHNSVDRLKRYLSSYAAEDGDLRSPRGEKVTLRFGRTFQTKVSAATLTELSRSTCLRARDTVLKALADAGLEPMDVDAYFMVGGSAKLPLMRELLTETFGGREPNPAVGPYGGLDMSLAVVKGAAVYDLDREDIDTSELVLPVLQRVLPYTVSLLVRDKDDQRVAEPLLLSGTELPAATVTTPIYLKQASNYVDIKLYVGQGDPELCKPLANRRLEFDIPKQPGEPINIDCRVSADGSLIVSAMDDGLPIIASVLRSE